MAEFPHYQVLAVGAGPAGLRAAVAVYDLGRDVAVLSRVYPIRSRARSIQRWPRRSSRLPPR